MRTGRFWLLLLLSLSSFSVRAQTTQLKYKPVYVERYERSVPVSGGKLVGLGFPGADSVATPAAHASFPKFDPQGVRARVPADIAAQSVCVSITSRDGVYHADNVYQLQAGAVTFQAGTARPEELARFNAKDMAVVIRVVPSCKAAVTGPTVLIPFEFKADPQADGGPLVAYLNMEVMSLTRVELSGTGGAAMKARCVQAPEDDRTSFVTRCLFDRAAALPGGLYTLQVLSAEDGTPYTSTYKVRIPGR